MGSTAPSIAILPSQHQCAICLPLFSALTDAQSRINARFHRAPDRDLTQANATNESLA